MSSSVVKKTGLECVLVTIGQVYLSNGFDKAFHWECN